MYGEKQQIIHTLVCIIIFFSIILKRDERIKNKENINCIGVIFPFLY